MKNKNIKILLVQINEAHSTAWNISLPNAPNPQKTFSERVERCNNFVEDHKDKYDDDVFLIKIDPFDNRFENLFRIWPDEFYLIDSNYRVIAKSEYSSELPERDGVTDIDCNEYIEKLIK